MASVLLLYFRKLMNNDECIKNEIVNSMKESGCDQS